MGELPDAGTLRAPNQNRDRGSSARAGMAPTSPPYVSSDVGRLERVLVQSPGVEIYKAVTVAPDDHSVLPRDLVGAAAVEQHRIYVDLLRRGGVRVLSFGDALDDAIANARAEGQLRPWLEHAFPDTHHDLIAIEDRLTSALLIGADDEAFYRAGEDGAFRPIVRPVTSLFFIRDFVVTTPPGLVVCHLVNRSRRAESRLVRFAFRWSTELRAYRVVFDALKE